MQPLEHLKLIKDNPGVYRFISDEDLADLILQLIETKSLFKKASVKLKPGEPGKDGKTPKAGIDYLSRKQQEALIRELISGIKLPTPIPGAPGKDGEDAEITEEDIENIVTQVYEKVLPQLPEPPKLDDIEISSIKGLEEALKEAGERRTTALIARYLDQIGDVDTSGATNGQALAYDATNKKWTPQTISGGGGGSWGSITGTLSDQTDLQTALDAKADLAGDTFTGDISVPDEAYGVGWDNSLEVPTKNAIYDKIETLNSAEWGNITGTLSAQTDLQNELNAKQDILAEGAFVDGDKTQLDATETTTQLNTRDTNNRNRTNHTGSQLASTISDFAATVRSTVLTGLSTATNAVITASDTVLSALGKLQAQITANETKIATQATDALVQSPTATEDGYAIKWNDTNQEYELGTAGGAFTDIDTDYGAETVSSAWDFTGDFSTQSITDDGTLSITPTATFSNAPYSIVNDEATTNLVVNPKFEVNVTDGWSVLTTGAKTRTTSEKWYGSASMQVDTSASNSGVQTSAISVDASSTYVFSFYVKGASGGEAIDIRLVPDVSSATDTSSGFSFPDTTMVTDSWQRFDWYVTTGASDTTVTCQIRAKTASAQTFYVDGVQFEKKTLPAGSTDNYHPSTYCDGSMGDGYTWSGTADNSTSSRTAGVHFLAPIKEDNAGALAQRTDGSFARAYFRADEITSSQIADADEPAFPFQFTGDMLTDVTANGTPGGILYVENVNNGNTGYFKSGVTTREGLIFDFSSLTSGVGLAIYAPADLSTMASSGGVFFKFAGKDQNSDMYKWGVDYSQAGDLGFTFDNRHTMFGGGGMDGVVGSNNTGTVSSTSGSAIIAGTGTTFLTDYKRGDKFQWQWDGSAWVAGTVASIASNISLTLTANAANTTAAPRNHRSEGRQYSPAVLQLEGNYAYHGGGDGDYMYSLYPSGGNGQPRWMKSSALENTALPTADNDGDAIVVGRDCDETGTSFTSADETTVYNGYTIPAYELQAGNWLSGKMMGTITALNATTTTLTIRIKLGGTTILTSNAFVVGSTNATAFKLNFDIVGTSTTAQKVSLDIVGKDNTTTSAPTFSTVEYGTGSRDMRIDRALTVTFDFNDASTANVRATSIKLEN